MKRIHIAALGAIVVACVILIVGGYAWYSNRSNSVVQNNTAGPVYAYVDLEHIMMSHPEYSKYHHLELEYNAMVAEYQFEQWNYSSRAVAQEKAIKQYDSNGLVMSAALDQELKAKVALKENELNEGLKKKSDELIQAKRAAQPGNLNETDLKIVNLKLKLRTIAMSEAEKQATEEELYRLMRNSGPKSGLSNKLMQEVAAEMAPYKEKAARDLAAYAEQVKQELQNRQQTNAETFQKSLSLLGNRPEPMIWNQEWKDKLDSKEKEMDNEKEVIMADIRDKAAIVAKEQGIEVIFSDYLGFGTALDVTDDIIAKLA